ncbi:uncharacterized protein N7484_000257 [Penicillium longicatenatum]|uniref:uncharacterized protein n=1 Tax=Penicillium longicatenatum TaxID=1561947 RepID=UPI0025475A0F|nr:uncharacterized protein N7484_000257 [Penicillium longicatenatum]KAJ5660885.1 hypothetical protein N7484_000257 [Penicillium longicatenatum]
MAQPPLETFQIGWICALPIEAAAAKEMLDESFGILDVQDPSDSNTYTLGRIGKHHVAIACLPAGQYGITSATTVANNMVRTFSKSLRVGLMVGVGGGIPSAGHDIRLGDVVISCPEGTSGGVLQYDMGKVSTSGEFHRTGSLNSPPRALLAATNLMRATELTDDPCYPEFLLKAISRTARTRKAFDRPQEDRLFKFEHIHPTTVSTCDGCLAEWEETRSERETTDPQSHYGIIASGNAVIKDGYTREQLRLATGALCFEMEAAGLMMDFPCVVVRGICDYADTHKNKQWQGYAALAAASYTKELLGYIPTTQVSQENLVVDMCSGLKEEIQGTNKRLDRAYDQQEQHHNEQKTRSLTDQQQRCHQVFKVANYEEQKNINPKRVEGTCQWALQSAEYIRWWESSSNDLLWASADPGCGKSVLARSIIDDDLQDSSLAVTTCFFFFKDNDEQNHIDTALCSVLHQLFSQRPQLLPYALPSWEKNGEKLRNEVDELWRIFITAASAGVSFKTICIFDALDECRESDQARLIEKLQSFHHQTTLSTQDASCLKFLITSRPYDHIQNHFRAITDSFPHIHIKGEEENDRIHEEIDLVVKVRVKELADDVQLPLEAYQRVEQQLLQMEHRTYLWLYLAIDDIRTTFQHSLRPAKNSITLIPPSVTAAYEKILCRVPVDETHTVKKILEIIVAARRPLTIREMAMALGIATCSEARTIMEAGLDLTHLLRKVRQLCGLFVFTNNSKIYLIHQTAREFLIRKQNSDNLRVTYWSSLSDAENQMAEICLRYLLMEDLEDEEGQPSLNVRDLLEYSAVHWADHVRKMTFMLDQKAQNRLHSMYDMPGKRIALWFPIFWKAANPYMNLPSMNALNLASFNGHGQEVEFLLAAQKYHINSADDTGTNSLIWASQNGHDQVVQMLLEHGADVNAQGGIYGNALYVVSSGGHDQIVQMLLEHRAGVNAQGGRYGNALYVASCEGHDHIVQRLLEHGADVNAQGGEDGDALYAASSRGHDQIVQMLLEHGADVNAEGSRFGNALHVASCEGHDQIVQMLLEHGADVNAQGSLYRNALYVASCEGHDQIVQMLLEHGADVNVQGGRYGNALQVASCEGHDQIVQMLLEHGADVNAQGSRYGNALQVASSRGHNKIVQMLLEHGADVNAQGGIYGNALYVVSSGGHDQIVQMLLEHGADVNVQGGRYGNALQVASSGGHDQIVQMLLEHGADVNAQGSRYGNALQVASSRGHDKIVQILLERGAD